MAFSYDDRLVRQSLHDERLSELIAEALTDVPVKIAIAVRAEEALIERRAAAAAETPTTPDTADGLDKWLTAATKQYLATVAARDAQMTVLADLQARVEADVRSIFYQDDSIDAILSTLSDRFTKVWGAAVQIVVAMDEAAGFPVCSVADAVRGGCAEQWRTLWDIPSQITEIRRLQRDVYTLTRYFQNRNISTTALGDGRSRTDERLYFFRTLDQVTPGWEYGDPVPWPDDDAARLVWCIRKGAGAWVPTSEQLLERLATPEPPALPDMVTYEMTNWSEQSAYITPGREMGSAFATARPEGQPAEDILRHVRTAPNIGPHVEDVGPRRVSTAFSARFGDDD